MMLQEFPKQSKTLGDIKRYNIAYNKTLGDSNKTLGDISYGGITLTILSAIGSTMQGMAQTYLTIKKASFLAMASPTLASLYLVNEAIKKAYQTIRQVSNLGFHHKINRYSKSTFEKIKSLGKATISPFSKFDDMMNSQINYMKKQEDFVLTGRSKYNALRAVSGGSILNTQERNYELAKDFVSEFVPTIDDKAERSIFKRDEDLREYYSSDPNLWLYGRVVPKIMVKSKFIKVRVK